MFSNSTEWDVFMRDNCYLCSKYVEYEESDEIRPVCPIEERIAMGIKELFPYEHLAKTGNRAKYECQEFECDI